MGVSAAVLYDAWAMMGYLMLEGDLDGGRPAPWGRWDASTAGLWLCPGWIMFALLVMGFPGAAECCNYIAAYLKAGLN